MTQETPHTTELEISTDDRLNVLKMCAKIANDNRAVLMLLGYGDDYENFTGVYLEDYEDFTDKEITEILTTYPSAQLWITDNETQSAARYFIYYEDSQQSEECTKEEWARIDGEISYKINPDNFQFLLTKGA